MRAIQVIDECNSLDEAHGISEFHQTQVGYLGGRIMLPTASRATWVVQTFHDAGDVGIDDPLPDGCRVVMIPHYLKQVLGIVV